MTHQLPLEEYFTEFEMVQKGQIQLKCSWSLEGFREKASLENLN